MGAAGALAAQANHPLHGAVWRHTPLPIAGKASWAHLVLPLGAHRGVHLHVSATAQAGAWAHPLVRALPGPHLEGGAASCCGEESGSPSHRVPTS